MTTKLEEVGRGVNALVVGPLSRRDCFCRSPYTVTQNLEFGRIGGTWMRHNILRKMYQVTKSYQENKYIDIDFLKKLPNKMNRMNEYKNISLIVSSLY